MGKADNLKGIREKTQFTSENQPAGAGRKKNIFKYLKADFNLSQDDLRNIIDYISLMPQSKFKEIIRDIKDEDPKVSGMPMVVYKLMQAYAVAKLDDLIKLMRASGKAAEQHDVNIPNFEDAHKKINEVFERLNANNGQAN